MRALVIVLASVFLAANVGLVAGQGKEIKAKTKSKATTQTVKSAKRSGKSKTKFVQVTGSNIMYRVEDGQKTPNTPLHVTVIDVADPENRGYSSVMDVLRRNPTISPAIRGY